MLYSYNQPYIHIYMQKHIQHNKDERKHFFRKIYLSLYLKWFERVTKCFTVWEVSWRLNRTATYWGPQPLWDMVPIPASSLQLIWDSELQLLNRGSRGPPRLGAGSLYNTYLQLIWTSLSPVLYNNLTPTLLPASVTISHLIHSVDSHGYPLYTFDRMHLLFTQLHFLFWQLGWVQYETFNISIKKDLALKYLQGSIWYEIKPNKTKNDMNYISFLLCFNRFPF